MTASLDRETREIMWLLDHPEFEEMPATIEEFLGAEYLDFTTARPGLIEALKAIFGEEVNADRISNFERAMVTGGIGIGKTTFASIAIPYMVHHTLCLKNPQKFYGLASGSRIAFMQMSTSAKQALEVIFGDLKARVQHSKWFAENFPFDPAYEKQMRFPKDVWVLPGGSSETGFEGYNILGGILDEMDSHKITDKQDYADIGFDAIQSRIASRFTDFSDVENMGHRGLLICIGQMKKSSGFADRKYREFLADPKAYVMRMSIWESFGWDRFTRPDGTHASFWYDSKTKKIIPTLLATVVDNKSLIEVPNAYKAQFDSNPEKALRDLAGIPPATSDPFISQVDRIESCRDRWDARNPGKGSPVKPNPSRPEFEDWFGAYADPRKRALHLDFALSGNGDAMGIAFGYVAEMVERESETKPYIVLDALIRIKAMPGTEIMYSEVRNMIYNLRDDYGFRISSVSMDGFQSSDTKQQLRKRKFFVHDLSADKSTLPYEDLREAINEERLEFPRYVTYLNKGDTELVEIAVRELMQLSYTGKKIDHPPDGSKDVADAMAGVVTTLMGDRSYSRGVRSASPSESTDESVFQQATGTTGLGNVLPFPAAVNEMRSMRAPTPGEGLGGLTIPQRLRPPER